MRRIEKKKIRWKDRKLKTRRKKEEKKAAKLRAGVKQEGRRAAARQTHHPKPREAEARQKGKRAIEIEGSQEGRQGGRQ